MNQSKLEVIRGSWRKAREKAASESQLVLVLLLIGWKIGANFLSQSCSVANAKPITFRHSSENRSKANRNPQNNMIASFSFASTVHLTQWSNYLTQRAVNLTRRSNWMICLRQPDILISDRPSFEECHGYVNPYSFHAMRIDIFAQSLRSFHWNRTYTEISVKLCLLIVYIIGT